MNPYILIIAICLVVIASFFFNAISKKTNVPSVLMLVILGVIINQFLSITGYVIPNQMKVLELLGIVGLIMIVLEAALDLELEKEKWPIIWKSFTIAIFGLGATSIFLSSVFRYFFQNIDFLTSMIYAIPLAIMSSAIVIPSVSNLSSQKKEFMIYESTFSDILGIMLFYLLLENVNSNSFFEVSWSISSSIFLTIAVSLIVTYLLLYSFQNVTSEIKFFLFLASLILLFSIGKLLHLSSLLIILVFGLVLRNRKFFIPRALQKFIKMESINGLFHNFQMITNESSFLIRTFFFVLFGMTISLNSLLSWKVWSISILFLVGMYGIRILSFRTVVKKDYYPEAFISPRGLISILLFFAIPEEFHVPEFESGVLFLTIISTAIVMAWSLIKCRKAPKLQEAGEKSTVQEVESNVNEMTKVS